MAGSTGLVILTKNIHTSYLYSFTALQTSDTFNALQTSDWNQYTLCRGIPTLRCKLLTEICPSLRCKLLTEINPLQGNTNIYVPSARVYKNKLQTYD